MSDHDHSASDSPSLDCDDANAASMPNNRPIVRQDQWSGFTIENVGPANEFQSVSLSIDGFNVLLTRTSDGLVVDVFASGDVAFDRPIATAVATEDDAKPQLAAACSVRQ